MTWDFEILRDSFERCDEERASVLEYASPLAFWSVATHNPRPSLL